VVNLQRLTCILSFATDKAAEKLSGTISASAYQLRVILTKELPLNSVNLTAYPYCSGAS